MLFKDPALPFVLMHNEVKLRARAYVRIPVRFVPIALGEFVGELVAVSEDGKVQTSTMLQGTCH
jgi:hypothetical protein